jgi:hypothetical protein
MARQEVGYAASERMCEAISPKGESCNFVPATVNRCNRSKALPLYFVVGVPSVPLSFL